MTAPDNGLAAPGTAAADLLRLQAEAIQEAFPDTVEQALLKLRTYEGWEPRIRALMQTCSEQPNAPNPAAWEATTSCWHATALRKVLETSHAAGIPCNDFADLQSAAVLDALNNRLRPKQSVAGLDGSDISSNVSLSNSTPLPRSWGGVFLHSILCSMRTCLHAAKLTSSAGLNARIVFHAKAERRQVNHKLFAKETYLQGAAALDAFGRIAQAIGRTDAADIRIGARLLAVAADGSPRRSEMGRADRRLVHMNSLAATPEVKVFIGRATSKARRTRILWLRDPRAIRLIEDLREGLGGHELFRRPDGQPIKLASLDTLLRRVTIMALGKPASYNMLRRANAQAQRTTAGRSVQLGRSPKSTQTNAIYNPDMVYKASSGLAIARERARNAALKASRLCAIDTAVNDPTLD